MCLALLLSDNSDTGCVDIEFQSNYMFFRSLVSKVRLNISTGTSIKSKIEIYRERGNQLSFDPRQCCRSVNIYCYLILFMIHFRDRDSYDDLNR